MPKIEIKDNILAPEEQYIIRFNGKAPFKAVEVTKEHLKAVLKISGSHIYDDHLKWDVTESPKGFYGFWRAKYDEDRWSTTWFTIIIQGELEKDNTGWVNILIRAKLTTTYTYSNFIQRFFWWVFNRAFYYKQRRNYIDYCKELAQQLRNEYRRTLGIQPQ